MFEACPLIDYRKCGFCTHHKGHIYCGASSARGNNKIEENLKICPVPRLRKVKEKREQQEKQTIT
jgi:hypothetical protein